MNKNWKIDLIDLSLNDIKKDIFLRMDYIEKLKKYTNTKQIIVIQWQRRCGKSHVILWLLKSLKISHEKIFYINKEKDELGSLKSTKDLSKLFEDFCAQRWIPEWIIIDEIQDIKDWEIFIRSKYSDWKFKIIISGSNSHLLNGEFATYLSGRYIPFFVYPFGYDEYKSIIDSKNIQNRYPNLFEQYMHLWWMPESILINDPEIQQDYSRAILNTVVIKDILERKEVKVRSVTLLLQVLEYLADITWSIVSTANITTALNIQNNDSISNITIWNYIKYLQDAYIIHEVKRYNIMWKTIFQNKNKYYFNDIWIRNSRKYSFILDRWKILENIVFLHLKRLWYDVFVGDLWNKEIDFVAKKWDNIEYIQVAWSINSEKVMDREFGNLLSIKDWYPKHVVSFDWLWITNHEWISYRNIETFLENFK